MTRGRNSNNRGGRWTRGGRHNQGNDRNQNGMSWTNAGSSEGKFFPHTQPATTQHQYHHPPPGQYSYGQPNQQQGYTYQPNNAGNGQPWGYQQPPHPHPPQPAPQYPAYQPPQPPPQPAPQYPAYQPPQPPPQPAPQYPAYPPPPPGTQYPAYPPPPPGTQYPAYQPPPPPPQPAPQYPAYPPPPPGTQYPAYQPPPPPPQPAPQYPAYQPRQPPPQPAPQYPAYQQPPPPQPAPQPAHQTSYVFGQGQPSGFQPRLKDAGSEETPKPMKPSTGSKEYDVKDLPDACWAWPPNLQERRKIKCFNCRHFHPPELCRGPLTLGEDSPVNRSKWLKYLVVDCRRGLPPLRTREDFSAQVDDDITAIPVLNPALAKIWERMVMSLDRAAKRDKYWNRFKWTDAFIVMPNKIENLLPKDPSIPAHLVGKGPPSWSPKKNGDGNMPSNGYPEVNVNSTSLYRQSWALFENTPRQPPDTAKTIEKAKELFTHSVSESEHAIGIKRGRDNDEVAMTDVPGLEDGPTKKQRPNVIKNFMENIRFELADTADNTADNPFQGQGADTLGPVNTADNPFQGQGADTLGPVNTPDNPFQGQGADTLGPVNTPGNPFQGQGADTLGPVNTPGKNTFPPVGPNTNMLQELMMRVCAFEFSKDKNHLMTCRWERRNVPHDADQNQPLQPVLLCKYRYTVHPESTGMESPRTLLPVRNKADEAMSRYLAATRAYIKIHGGQRTDLSKYRALFLECKHCWAKAYTGRYEDQDITSGRHTEHDLPIKLMTTQQVSDYASKPEAQNSENIG
ncbi:hypothetical protein PG988_011904 [Apiospora saccharicola]